MEALFDTGANANYISYEALRHLYGNDTAKHIIHHPSLVTIANKSTVSGLGKVILNTEINGRRICFEAIVLADLPFNIVLGLNFCKAHDVQLNPKDNCVHFGEPPEQKIFLTQALTIKPYHEVAYVAQLRVNNCNILISKDRDFTENTGLYVANGIARVSNRGKCRFVLANLTAETVKVPIGTALPKYIFYKEDDWFIAEELTKKLHSMNGTASSSTPSKDPNADDKTSKINVDWTQLSTEERAVVEALLTKFADIFALDLKNPGVVSMVKHTIDTGRKPPIRSAPYRVSMKERERIQTLVNDMLTQKIVKPSVSPWASPVVLVSKKDGSIRFCVDYRKLNAITVKDSYPLPRIDAALAAFHGSYFFSVVDMYSGYWQIPMSDEDRQKTAFVTSQGLFEFNVMPFGLTNAPATFQRFMDAVLAGIGNS